MTRLGKTSLASALLALAYLVANARGEVQTVRAQTYTVATEESMLFGEIRVFPIPVEDAVGSIDAESPDGIVVLGLSRGKIARKAVRFKTVLGSLPGLDVEHCLPVFKGTMFGYTQKRMFLLFDMRSKACIDIPVCTRHEQSVEGAYLVDSTAILFDIIDRRGSGGDVPKWGPDGPRLPTADGPYIKSATRILQLYGVAGKPLPQRTFPGYGVGYRPPVAAAQSTVFLFDDSVRTVVAMDRSLATIDHPLSHCPREGKGGLRRLQTLAVHPRLPLAVLVDRSREKNGDYIVYSATWTDGKPAIAPVPGISGEVTNLSFSPDGSWLVLYAESYPGEYDEPVYPTAFPVKASSPPTLGAPRQLVGTGLFAVANGVWCAGPQSFVAYDGGGQLFKWQLDATGP